MIITLDSIESTNRYCELLDLAEVEEFTCFRAVEQTAGIGQTLPSTGGTEHRSGNNPWFSGPRGENIAISIVLKPTFLPAADQFRLTQSISLAICDFLIPLTQAPTLPSPQGDTPSFVPPREGMVGVRKNLSPRIKWPNDIYVDGCKICGTLITTRLATQSIRHSHAIVGIGLNVNQLQFPSWVPNPTSLALLTGRQYDVAALLPSLLEACRLRYERIRAGEDPTPEYLSRLMNLGRPRRYLYGGQEIEATVTGVDRFGRLLLTAADGNHLCCVMKEIELLN